ncbi:hypothetical protein WH47_06246 [Habropoda laboriosa]|uniref:Deltamethrin resistance protein prag01 domain-containing protein n=1 Tax=Habropoda laboriosa TaxID=597456 RepID=A0A0L7RJZ2_9HYME|nr:PREDICTED: uncharacterized protein LOC108578650 [Habropoda laboriosa]KOC71185.1 hypothetical protein WH47_06246 [Habropoda laboriosa]
MFRHILRPIARNTRTGTRSYQVPHDVRPPSMDEVPVPHGSWQEAYNKAQTKYNLQLAAGVLVLIATIVTGRMNGTLWLNFLPPTPKDSEASK